jgi:molybdopterin synthase catalytic subunit
LSIELSEADIHVAVRDHGQHPLQALQALDFVSDPRFGGQCLFVGRIRNHNVGRDVVAVSYDLVTRVC